MRHSCAPGRVSSATPLVGARMRKIIGTILDTDVRHVLPSVRVPTLVVHRIGDRTTRVEGGRYLAANIPGAKIVEVPGFSTRLSSL